MLDGTAGMPIALQRPLTDKVGGSDNGPRQRSPELSDAELDAFLSGGSFTHRQNRVPAVGPIEPTREGELPQIAKFLVRAAHSHVRAACMLLQLCGATSRCSGTSTPRRRSNPTTKRPSRSTKSSVQTRHAFGNALLLRSWFPVGAAAHG